MKPLFSNNAEEIAHLLRMDKLPAGGSGQRIFENAVTQARSSLWRLLGTSIIDEMVAITYTADPSSTDEYRRLEARQLEIDVIRYHLAGMIPMSWKGGRAEFERSWNTDGNFQFMTPEQVDGFRAGLWAMISERAGVVKGELTAGTAADRVALHESENPALLYDYSYFRGEQKIES